MATKIKRLPGFTLMELMVTISIIGLLSSIILVAVSNARAKARDAHRVATARQVITALDLYFSLNSSFPDSSLDSSASTCNGWSVSNSASFLQPLITNKILSTNPKDAINSGGCALGDFQHHFANLFIKRAMAAFGSGTNPNGYILAYQYFNAGTNGCDPNLGNYYVLGIKTMNSIASGASYPGSPGMSCTGHNWQTDFAWVTGEFEK